MSPKQPTPPVKKKKSLWRRLLKYAFWALLFLLVFVFGSSYYFLNTNSGLKRAISLANRFSGYEIKADSIDGKLLNKTELKNVSIKGKLLNFQSDNVVLDWQSKDLFDKSVTVKAITLKNSVVELIPSEEKSPKQQGKPFDLTDINLPFNLRLEDFLVENLTLQNPVTQKPAFIVERLQVGIDYVGKVGKINTFTFRGEGLDLQLKGQIETRGDFPLLLENSTQYQSKAYGDEIVEMTVKGSLKKQLDIHVLGKGLSDFSFNSTVTSPLKSPEFTADFVLQKVDTTAFGFVDTAATANITANGKLDNNLQVNTQGEIFYQSPQTDKIKLNFSGDFDGDQLIIPTLNVGLLTAKQQLTGKANYRLSDSSLDVHLTSPILQYPQQQPTFSAQNLQLTVNGRIDDYHVVLNTDTQSDMAGSVPLSLQANGSTTALKTLTANAMINGKPLDIIGNATWSPTLAYQAKVTAPEILPIQQFPGIKNLDITVNGDNRAYQAKGGLHLYADNIPPADIRLDINGDPKTLKQADLTVDMLGGTAQITAHGELSPLDITANVGSKQIQPHRFYPHVNGNINSEIVVKVKQIAEQLQVVSTIEQLTGKLQGQPLSGKGVVTFSQADKQLDFADLAVNLAGNRINANGQLALSDNGQSDLTAHLDAQHLKRLLPDLGGSLLANLTVKGNLSAPEISGKINGRKLSYQQHHINVLNSDIALSLKNDSVTINSQAEGLKSGSNIINQAELAVNGKISQHQIKAVINTPNDANIPRVKLVGKGGFNQQTLAWSGHLQQLNVDSALAGKWQLTKPTALTLSADNIAVNTLCLQQQSASLCADGKLQQQNGKFKVKVKNLKTAAFARLLPDTVKLDTTLNADTDIVLVGGKPEIKGQLSADGGRLKLSTGSGGLDDKIEQLDTKFTLKNNQLQATVTGKLAKMGAVNFATEIPNVGQNKLKAKVKINTPKLNFLQELVPQLSNVKGSLSGDMTVSGTPGEQLSVAGKVTLHETDFNIPQFGTRIRGLTLDIFAKNGNQIGFKGGAKAGDGDFKISGNINPNTRQGEIDIKGKNFQVADSRQLKVAINPDLRIVFADTIKIRGDIFIPKALIVPTSTGSKITASEDVVLPHSKGKKQPTNSPIDVEVGIKLGDDVRVASADIETRLLGGINVVAKPGKVPTANGVISIKTGALRVYGQQLNIKRGRVIFSNGPIANPALDVRAIREIDDEDVTVGVNVLGYVSKPEISLFSTPSMPDSSILSYLLFGKPPNSDTFSTTALLQTGGLVGANTIARDIRSATGLDVLDISFNGLEAGKNLTKKIYVGVHSNFFDSINQFLLKYKISGKTRIEATIGSDGVSTDLIKEIETD